MTSRIDLAVVERAAMGHDVVALVVTYFDRREPVEYAWANRKQVRWSNVRKASLRLAGQKWFYVGKGDYRRVDRVRIKPR